MNDMPATLFENDLAEGATPAQTGATILTSGIGDAIRNLWPVCQAVGRLEAPFASRLEAGWSAWRIKRSLPDQLWRNRQKLRDEPRAVKV
jgi:hypothetical protein